MDRDRAKVLDGTEGAQMQGRQKMRGVVVGTALAAASLALVACGGGTAGNGGAPATQAGPVKVAAVIKGLDNPFFQSMQKGIEDESATVSAQTTVQAAQSITDTTGQADKLTGLAGQDFG